MARLFPPIYETLLHVLQNLRELDREEFECMMPGPISDTTLARVMLNLTDMQWVVHADDDEPIATFGAKRIRPGVAEVWALGTPRWPEGVRCVTKQICRVMIPTLKAQGFHRAECRALASRVETAKWLSYLGARPEGPMRSAGTNGQDVTIFAWMHETPEDLHKRSR